MDNDPATPKKVVVVAIVHHMPWATAWAGPSKHVGGNMGTARPGPARHNFHIGPALPGPDKRPMTSPDMYDVAGMDYVPGI